MIEIQTVTNNISELRSYMGGRLAKYMRNYRRYNNTPYTSIQNIRSPSVVGYWTTDFSSEDDTTPTPNVNVIKSCIDTLTSKIAQSKVRPFFNCVNGTFKDIQIVKQAQQYFDQFFDLQDVNKKVSEAFRDACIFERGCLYVNDISQTIERVLPWQVYLRPSEENYNHVTRGLLERKEFPVTCLPEELKKKVLEASPTMQYVTYLIYYDTVAKVRVQVIEEMNIYQFDDYESAKVPFIQLHYSSPIVGNSSLSIVDMLNSIQLEIDILMSKVKDASQLSPALTFFVPEGNNVKVAQLDNRVGNIIQYRPTPNMTSSPVTTSAPAFIDGQYMETVERLKQTAYELVGISNLSAQSQKPAGLNSGIALQTMENIESDRFETQLNQVIRAYVDIAKTCINVYPKEQNILPDSDKRLSIKWKDIVEEVNRMSIQFSGADALSKDPSTKLQQLQMMAQAGILPQSRIAQFMEIPDIDTGYSLSNSAVNAVLTCIDDCLATKEEESFELPDFMPFTMLKEEILNTQLSLYAINKNGKNDKDIEKLNALFEQAEDKEAEWTAANAPAEGGAPDGIGSDDNPLPQGQNILSQEVNLQRADSTNNNVDMDMATHGASGNWNR